MRFAYISQYDNPVHRQYALSLTESANRELLEADSIPEDAENWLADNDIDMLIISTFNRRRALQHCLDRCREIRIPYLILTDTMTKLQMPRHLLLPVSMLEEEVNKGQIASNIARFTNAYSYILKAHDYGHKAQINTQKIVTLFERFNLQCEVVEAKTDSFHVNREAVERQKDFQQDMVVLTASRAYGLDDIIFGPQERHCLAHSQVPVLLVNPRGDLYALCD